MARKSENKVIIDQVLFDENYSRYHESIRNLTRKYHVVNASEYGNLVNFQQNLSLERHKWYEYKQGYSRQLVANIINKANPDKSKAILDPFCGVGTSNLTAQSLGYRSIGIDINPIAILAAKTKTHFYTQEEINEIRKLIAAFQLKNEFVLQEMSKVVETSYRSEDLSVLMKIRYFWENIDNGPVRDFFRLAFISILDICSTKVKDGNGLKNAPKKKQIKDIPGVYLNKCQSMLDDIDKVNYDIKSSFIFGSAISSDLFAQIKPESIGLCVYSPPYANCFDYCEVYKLELWLGGFVSHYDDFKNYRNMAMRSHVNSTFDHTITHKIKNVEIIASTISAFNLWNKNIPDMLRGYFDDSSKLLYNVYKSLCKNSYCYIVVANSAYKGVMVPTDLLLCEIAESKGFSVENIYFARKIRASSQQIDELNREFGTLMRESIIELKK